MALKKGTQVSRGYATVAEDDGVNYRDIADTLTEIGYPMNHSSVRNYVLRIMRRFVAALAEEWDIDLAEGQIDEIAKSPQFQQGISDVLHIIEGERRLEEKTSCA